MFFRFISFFYHVILLQVCKSICSFFCLPAQYCYIVCVFNKHNKYCEYLYVSCRCVKASAVFFVCLHNIIVWYALFNGKYSYEYCCYKLFCCRCVKASAFFFCLPAQYCCIVCVFNKHNKYCEYLYVSCRCVKASAVFFVCLHNIIVWYALFNRKYSYEYCCFKLFCCRCVKASAIFFVCLHNIIVWYALFNRKYSYEYCCFKLFCCRCVKASAIFFCLPAQYCYIVCVINAIFNSY